MNKRKLILIILFFTCLSIEIFSQIHVPLNMRGDRKYRKEGIHNSNLVETLFYNFGEVAWWGREPSGVWPKGSGHSYMDGITPIVAAEVVDANGNTIRIVEAGYRENMDISPTGVERGWQPRPGYVNPNQDNIAMSDKPITWPESWPDKDASWNGFWNGYFGKRTNADQESFFVMDDNSDDGPNFYPDSTDHTRKGLGTSVIVRGFQWSNLLAEDIVFWHYEITNEGTENYSKIIFGMYVDCGVGGQYDSNDDYASFDIGNDITYSWDHDGIGQGGWQPTGFAGYAFLESPGNGYNAIDDDNDGEVGSPSITNQMLIGELKGNGIDDNGNGLVDEDSINVGMKYADGIDNNGDGKIDEMIDETRDDGIDNDGNWNSSTDDVGLDGLAGTGDFGEGDGLPTSGWQLPGVVPGAPTFPVNKFGLIDTKQPGEPHIDKTDKNESDQIGLTAFDVFFIGSGVVFREDNQIWNRISYSHFDTRLQNGNIAFLFGSGPFILPAGTTERFSLALVFGTDLEDIQRNKQVVQDIYDYNYNFARPPDKPTLTAIPGDGKVTLYWDDAAENSYDDFLNEYDFEGYKIYRSTDPGFIDSYTITSGYGENALFKPSAQFDIVNEVHGFFPLDYQGVKIYMGDNKGLKHSWVDNDVINGQTYYYALVSYDKGNVPIGVYPSECAKVIVRDLAGNISIDKNTAYVTPGTRAAGYNEPGLVGGIEHSSGFATGTTWVEVLNPMSVADESFVIKFNDTTHPDTIYYSLHKVNGIDTTDIFTNSPHIDGEDFNLMFNGIRVLVMNDTIAFDPDNSGWKDDASNLIIQGSLLRQLPGRVHGYPSSYEIRVGEPDSSWRFGYRSATNFQVWDVYENEKSLFYFWEPTGQQDEKISAGDYITIWKQVEGIWREIWKFSFVAPPNQELILPEDGDEGEIIIKTPFRTGDVYTFTTKSIAINQAKAEEDMNLVAVVPNPYVGAAKWEPQRLTSSGRGERRIYFIHLPREATIRIYTISGYHVNTIYHNSANYDGQEPWNLTNKEGLDIAPGVYIYHVESPGLPDKIDKFAIIK